MVTQDPVPKPPAYPDPETADHITYNPSFAELRELSAEEEVTTEYGSPSDASDYRSRSAEATANTLDDDFDDEDIDRMRG